MFRSPTVCLQSVEYSEISIAADCPVGDCPAFGVEVCSHFYSGETMSSPVISTMYSSVEASSLFSNIR